MLLNYLRGDLEVDLFRAPKRHFTTKTQKISLSRSLRGLQKPVNKKPVFNLRNYIFGQPDMKKWYLMFM